jgi:hypothetical protein
VQHSNTDGEPPYLVAFESGAENAGRDLEFLFGDTATPLPFRYALSNDTLGRSRAVLPKLELNPHVQWEDI